MHFFTRSLRQFVLANFGRAPAIGRLAIGRLAVRKGSLASLEIGELTVSRLKVKELQVEENLQLPAGQNRELRNPA